MSNLILYGKDYLNNTNKALNVSNNGELKVYNDLTNLRKNGYCYILSDYGLSNNLSQTIIGFKNTGSQTCYVYAYDIKLSFKGTGDNIQLFVGCFNGDITGGSTINSGSNMKVDGDLHSDITIKKNGFSITSALNNYHYSTYVSSDLSTDTDTLKISNYIPEMLEIPSGYGLYVKYADNDNNHWINYSYSIKYIVAPNGLEL